MLNPHFFKSHKNQPLPFSVPNPKSQPFPTHPTPDQKKQVLKAPLINLYTLGIGPAKWAGHLIHTSPWIGFPWEAGMEYLPGNGMYIYLQIYIELMFIYIYI